MSTEIRIPRFDYMCQKNTYSGSVGSFRYKVFPKNINETDKVFVAATYRNNCFEVEDAAGRTEKKEFEYSPEGLLEAEAWISGQSGD
ncbi:MAG: hypothetical protein K5836_00440 [Clostridiales bacterium]|jgi:hypothetical protein|nr:hypothetical protein [Clostridiales bacterium]